LLALLILVLSVAGCTVPGTSTVTGNGVVIEAFEPDFPQAFAKESIQFQIRVKNTGSVDAEKVQAKLLGLEDWAKKTSTCQDTLDSTNGIKLLAPVPEQGVSGESESCIWTYTAPETPQGLSVTYNPHVRLYYEYKSNTVKSITFASQQELRNIESSGKALPAETVSSTNSPVSITIVTKGPIRFWTEGGTGSVTFPLEIKIDNVGGGVVCSSVDDCKNGRNWNKLKLTIKKSKGLESEDCKDYFNGKEIELWRGQSNTIVCRVTVSELSTVGAVQRLVEAEANYGYFIDRSTSVTVNWRETS